MKTAELDPVIEKLDSFGYGDDTVGKVEEYYKDGKLPHGDSRERARKIESRLHRIYPEKFLSDRYENEPLNHIFSIVQTTENEENLWVIPEEHYRDLDPGYNGCVDGIYFDHCTLYNVFNRTNVLVEPPVDILEPDDMYEIPWHKPLDVVDDALQLEEENGLDLDIGFPGDVYFRARTFKGGSNKHKEYEAIRYFERIGDRFKISLPQSYSPGDYSFIEDKAIAEGILRQSDEPVLMTFDRHFTDIEGVDILPPDLTHLTLKTNWGNSD
ncbi:MAG: hypothetical protein ABEJ72_07640 [Candidatus Aenigmatarchaeota archaeon]